MDEVLIRRLIGATVLLLLAFGLASLLPAPDREAGEGGQTVVAYDLRTGQPLKPASPVPPPAAQPRPVEIAREPDAQDPDEESVTDEAGPSPAAGPAAAADSPKGPAASKPPVRSGHPSLKVDESFGAANPGWYVQIGSFSSRDNARSVLQKLFKLGLPAMMQNVTVGKGLWYRVRVGPYPSEPPAQQALSAVRGQGYASAKVVRPDAGGN